MYGKKGPLLPPPERYFDRKIDLPSSPPRQCGITDFSFQDLLKPSYDRLARIFSYLINFVRFRESQTAVIDEHFNRAETTKARIETLFVENQDLEVRLGEMQRGRAAREAQVRDKVKRNDALKARLLELKQGQDKMAKRLERVKDEKARLTGRLEDQTALALGLRQESAKLRPYVLQSPAALQSSLADLSAALAADRARIDALDRRARALQTSADTFGVVTADVAGCVRLLDEIAAERRKEDDETARASRHRDALAERGNNAREIERTEQLLQRQLAKWLERTDKLRQASHDRAVAATARMDELRALHRRLTDERADKARDMDRRRVRIEQTEKKMDDLKASVEREIQSAHDEYLKLDAHIRLYITEMEQSLSDGGGKLSTGITS